MHPYPRNNYLLTYLHTYLGISSGRLDWRSSSFLQFPSFISVPVIFYNLDNISIYIFTFSSTEIEEEYSDDNNSDYENKSSYNNNPDYDNNSDWGRLHWTSENRLLYKQRVQDICGG